MDTTDLENTTTQLLSSFDDLNDLADIVRRQIAEVAAAIHNPYVAETPEKVTEDTRAPGRYFTESDGTFTSVNYKKVTDQEWIDAEIAAGTQIIDLDDSVDISLSDNKPPKGIVRHKGKIYTDILRDYEQLPENLKDLNRGPAKFLVPKIIILSIEIHNHWVLENHWKAEGLPRFETDEYARLVSDKEKLDYIYSLALAAVEAKNLPAGLENFLPFKDLKVLEAKKDPANIISITKKFTESLTPADLESLYEQEHGRWVETDGIREFKNLFPSFKSTIVVSCILGSVQHSFPITTITSDDFLSNNIYAVAASLREQFNDLTKIQIAILDKLVPYNELSEANQSKVRSVVDAAVDTSGIIIDPNLSVSELNQGLVL